MNGNNEVAQKIDTKGEEIKKKIEDRCLLHNDELRKGEIYELNSSSDWSMQRTFLLNLC